MRAGPVGAAGAEQATADLRRSKIFQFVEAEGRQLCGDLGRCEAGDPGLAPRRDPRHPPGMQRPLRRCVVRELDHLV
jgi:hypothetical protein